MNIHIHKHTGQSDTQTKNQTVIHSVAAIGKVGPNAVFSLSVFPSLSVFLSLSLSLSHFLYLSLSLSFTRILFLSLSVSPSLSFSLSLTFSLSFPLSAFLSFSLFFFHSSVTFTVGISLTIKNPSQLRTWSKWSVTTSKRTHSMAA